MPWWETYFDNLYFELYQQLVGSSFARLLSFVGLDVDVVVVVF